MANMTDKLAEWLVQNQDRRGTKEYEQRARLFKAADQYEQEAANLDPTAGMSGFDKFMAGAGKAASDVWTGAKQIVGAVPQEEVDAAARRDAPLMNTGAGLAGNVAGNIAATVLPGGLVGAAGKAATLAPNMTNIAKVTMGLGRSMMAPTTITGAAAQGAAFGALQPVTTESGNTRANNMWLGGALGAAIPAAIGAVKLGRSVLVDPFTKGGQEKLAGQALERFASNPQAIATATPRPAVVPGSVPTLAESVDDVGLSQLQRTLQNNPEANKIIAPRLQANNAARINALQDIAGDEGLLALRKADRSAVAGEQYRMAFAQSANETPWIRGQITQLQKRPSFLEAWDKAARRAADAGVEIDPGNITQVSHYAKLELDDMIGKAVNAGENGKARDLVGIRDKLVSLMESKDFAPAYREARETYKAMSRPINQQEVGQELLKKMRPALASFGDEAGQIADPRVNAEMYARALRDGDATAARVLEFPGAKIDNVMDPAQMRTLTGIASELSNSARAARQGTAIGSPTAQNLISQNVLRQTLGPFGLPTSWAEGAFARSWPNRALGALYTPAEKDVLTRLAEGTIDLNRAQELLKRAHKVRGFERVVDKSAPYLVPAATGMFALQPR